MALEVVVRRGVFPGGEILATWPSPLHGHWLRSLSTQPHPIQTWIYTFLSSFLFPHEMKVLNTFHTVFLIHITNFK